MGKNTELLKQLREILEPPETSPLLNDIETKLGLLTLFINARYVPKATYDKKINGAKHKAMSLDNNLSQTSCIQCSCSSKSCNWSSGMQ